MKNNTLNAVTEESVLIISIFKWIVISTIIGGVVGASIAIFITLLEKTTEIVKIIPHYYAALPFILVVTTLITRKISPDSTGHGTEKVIRAIHKKNGFMRLRIIPVKIFNTILTIAFGGSVGQEGPSAQIGATLASGFSRLFKFNAQDKKNIVICGICAGFSAVFGTPIAGAIFGVEVLFMGNLLYSVLLPSLISAIVSFQVAASLGLHHHYYDINVSQVFDFKFFMITLAAGIFFGLISVLFIEITKFVETKFKKVNISMIYKAIIGGTIISLSAFFLSTSYLGLGLDEINQMISGKDIIWYAFLVKILLTSITLASGGSGGVITPIFFVGSASGIIFADLIGMDRTVFAALGLVSVLGGAANTPLAACILSIELFGSEIAPYATVACVVSFLVTGYRSIFPSQILSTSKSQSISIKKGEEIEHLEKHYNYKTRRIMASGRIYAKRVLNTKKKHHK